MSTTWREAEPEPLPPLRLMQKLSGILRLAIFVAMTALVLLIFVIGRNMRARLGKWVSFHFAAALLWARIGLKLMGMRLRITGTPVKAGALVSNHCSWMDILTLRATGLMYFVSKAEVRHWPIVGYITDVAGTIFIERRRTEAKRQEEVLRQRIAADQRLIFFPEGTSTDGLRVLPFKSTLFSVFYTDGAAAEGQLLVQPVTVRYVPDPSTGLPASFYGWWGDMPFEAHIWDVFCRSRRGRAEVIFHEPVLPSAFEGRKALAEHAGRAVALGHSSGMVQPGPG